MTNLGRPDEQKETERRLNRSGSRLPQVAGYEVLEELGRGGMAAVYRARHLKLNRIVALKVLVSAHHASSEMLERFEGEARLIAGLSNPGIVQIHEVGTTDGLPYLALEYVPGGSLAARLAQAPITARQAAEMTLQMARSMQVAHLAGIVHRDLKPANVLLDAEGHPKIADFGIAKDLSSGAGQTRTGDVIGTPNYMAPEQASGISKTIGPATDVYALGAILYEMLTGRPPFRGQDPVETVLLVLTQEPVTVRRLAPRVDLDLETICSKCLQKDARKRYAVAGELADDLQRFLNGEPIRARRAAPPERVVKWVRRHPAWSALLAVLIFSIGGFTSYALWKNAQLSQLLNERNRSLSRSEQNFRNAITAVTRRIYSAGALQSDPIREELAFFEEIRKQAGDSEAARWERASAAGWCGTLLAKINEPARAEQAFAEALAAFQELHREFPDKLVHRRELADVQARYANFLSGQTRFDESQLQFDAAIRNFEELIQNLHDPEPNPPAELSDLKRQLRGQLAMVLNNSGVMLRQRGADPLARYQQALQIREELAGESPNDSQTVLDLAVSRMNLGAYHQAAQDWESAEALYRQSLIDFGQIPAEESKNEVVRNAIAGAQLNLAQVLTQVEDPEATQWFRSGTQLLEEWVKLSPRSVQAREMLIDARINWAKFALSQDDLVQAKTQLQAVIFWYENLRIEYPENETYQQALAKMKSYLQEVEKAAAEADLSSIEIDVRRLLAWKKNSRQLSRAGAHRVASPFGISGRHS